MNKVPKVNTFIIYTMRTLSRTPWEIEFYIRYISHVKNAIRPISLVYSVRLCYILVTFNAKT